MASLLSSGPNITWTKPALQLLCEWNCYIVFTRLKGVHVHRLSNETEKWTTQFTVLLSLTCPLTVSVITLLGWKTAGVISFQTPALTGSTVHLPLTQSRSTRSAKEMSSERKQLPACFASERMPYWKGLPEVSPPMFGYLLPLFTNSITSSHGSPLKRYELLILLTHCASAKGRLEPTNWFYTCQV